MKKEVLNHDWDQKEIEYIFCGLSGELQFIIVNNFIVLRKVPFLYDLY